MTARPAFTDCDPTAVEARKRRETAQSEATKRKCVKIAYRHWGRSRALDEAAAKDYRPAAALMLVNQVEAELAAEAKAKKEN